MKDSSNVMNLKRKTVFFIDSTDLSHPSASCYRKLAIARGLCERGVDVFWYILASPIASDIASDPHYKLIRFARVGACGGILGKSKPLMNLYRVSLLMGFGSKLNNLKKESSTLGCITFGHNFLHLCISAYLCKHYGIKLMHERTEYPLLASNSLFQKVNLYLYQNHFLLKCDEVFVISTSLKLFFDGLLKSHNVNVPLSIINMLVEPDRYAIPEFMEVSQYKDIVYVGTLYGDKDGVNNLIEAFAIVMDKHPKARLVIVGDTSKTDRMETVLEAIDKLPDPERVLLTGYLDRREVIRYLNRAYCLALARPDNIQAKYGFPSKLGEYLASGKPVVVTKVGDIPRFMTDGQNAYLAEPDDVDSFAQKLCDCLDNPDRAHEIGERGKHLAYTVFSYKECVKVILDAL